MNEQELEEIKEAICDEYCKYREEYLAQYDDPDVANTEMINEVCDYCPLGNLRI